MADKNANIDLLFRNGLKDYEVLPPPEVWNNIVPVIRRKQKTYVILRAAALVAVLVSLSIYAYRWSREVIIQMQNPEVALNEGSTQNRNNNVDKKPAGKSSLLSRQISKTRALPSDLFETETTIATAPSIEAEAETEAGPALAHLPDAIIVFPESALNPQANLIKQEKLFDTQNNSTVIQKPDVIKKPETQADDAYDIFKGNNGNLTGIEYKAPNTKKGKNNNYCISHSNVLCQP